MELISENSRLAESGQSMHVVATNIAVPNNAVSNGK